MSGAPNWQGALGRVSGATPFTVDGRVSKVLGPIIESHGPQAAVGEVCRLRMPDGSQVDAEVVAFHEDKLQLMPVGSTEGIGVGLPVAGTGRGPEIGPTAAGQQADNDRSGQQAEKTSHPPLLWVKGTARVRPHPRSANRPRLSTPLRPRAPVPDP